MPVDVLVTPEGTVRTLYHELWSLAALGPLRIERASHVEPTADGEWLAHIIAGPTLGPFPTRSAALAAEQDWLARERLVPQSQETTLNGHREDLGPLAVGDLPRGVDHAANQ
jgi:hypothetical protein